MNDVFLDTVGMIAVWDDPGDATIGHRRSLYQRQALRSGWICRVVLKR
jgi:hypothetical protein